MITTVAFDADQTLIDTFSAVLVTLELIATELNDEQLTAQQLRADSLLVWAEAPHRHAMELRTESFRRSLFRIGREDEAERVAKRFIETRFAHTKPYPGTLEVLAELRETYRLGYATNGNSLASQCGLPDQFSFELYAMGADRIPKKPHPDFFAATMVAAQASADQIVYVGDTYEHDIVAAAAAGMRTVWINREAAELPGHTQPDAIISSLTELPAVLKRLQ